MKQLPRHWAESVNLAAISTDGSSEINIRVAMKPAEHKGSIWVHLAVNGRQFSLVDESLVAKQFAGRIPGDSEPVAYAVSGDSSAEFTRGSQSAIQGSLRAMLNLSETQHPSNSPGDIPVAISADFTANGPGVVVSPGRLEVMGQVTAQIRLEGQTIELKMPGKWHEQLGERPSFAPAFTYLNVQADTFGLLAIAFKARATGYLVRGTDIDPITSFSIDPPGMTVRAFHIETKSGRSIAGSAQTLRNWSVPIEGQRRSGTTVRLTSNLGTALGSLNDWQPQEKP